MDKIEELKRKYYPNESTNGTALFYEWIRQYSGKNFTVLNLGAGLTADSKIKSLKGEVREVVGVDIDPEVLTNKDLDRAFVINNNRIPFEDNYFDLAWADYVMEHVENPANFLSETWRVLKPGASFFFRTPNMYHYVSLLSRMTPHWFHELVANRARRMPADAHEPYPTRYLFNNNTKVRNGARVAGFSQVELKFVETEPSYLLFHPLAFKLGVAYERTVNRYEYLYHLRANIFGRLQK